MGLASDWSKCQCCVGVDFPKVSEKEENCGCPPLPTILIQIGDKENLIKFSHKAEKDIEKMVQDLGIEATGVVLYCHICDGIFATQEELDHHKAEADHQY